MSETSIHKAIIAVMREVGAIGKNSTNVQQNYKFRSIEDVYNRVQPLFAEHGIFSYPKVIAQDRKEVKTAKGGTLHYAILTVEYTFAAEDGSSIAVTVVGEGMDSGDKASNKAMAAAHKYAICQVLNIPYQVIDPDAFTPHGMVSGVTRNQVTELKKAWVTVYRDMIDGMDKPQRREVFDQWLTQTIGDHDANMLDEADGYRYWKPEDLERCQKALPQNASD